jgi:hypothetical protein
MKKRLAKIVIPELNKHGEKIDVENQVNESIEVVKKIDKIFYNDYNTGNIDTEVFTSVSIDQHYSDSFLGDCYNAEEYEEKKALQKILLASFEKSEWKNFPKEKKFPKDQISPLFQYLFSCIDKNGHTNVDMFLSIAEFLDISCDKLFDAASSDIKEYIINELNDKYKILSKRKISRLF